MRAADGPGAAAAAAVAASGCRAARPWHSRGGTATPPPSGARSRTLPCTRRPSQPPPPCRASWPVNASGCHCGHAPPLQVLDAAAAAALYHCCSHRRRRRLLSPVATPRQCQKSAAGVAHGRQWCGRMDPPPRSPPSPPPRGHPRAPARPQRQPAATRGRTSKAGEGGVGQLRASIVLPPPLVARPHGASAQVTLAASKALRFLCAVLQMTEGGVLVGRRIAVDARELYLTSIV